METSFFYGNKQHAACSYRTYEEWKPDIAPYLNFVGMGSYRTYEEWKLDWQAGNGTSKILVLTVPMRNGNCTVRVHRLWLVPKFLPYLWGMETKYWKSEFNNVWMFLPYLWGMETLVNNTAYSVTYKFLPYLWGMETHQKAKSECLHYPFLPYLWGMET